MSKVTRAILLVSASILIISLFLIVALSADGEFHPLAIFTVNLGIEALIVAGISAFVDLWRSISESLRRDSLGIVDVRQEGVALAASQIVDADVVIHEDPICLAQKITVADATRESLNSNGSRLTETSNAEIIAELEKQIKPRKRHFVLFAIIACVGLYVALNHFVFSPETVQAPKNGVEVVPIEIDGRIYYPHWGYEMEGGQGTENDGDAFIEGTWDNPA